ncbi:MAG: four helix bundle protein [Bacteroidetes bacterium]|nr:four helix bundle protein [Bacteroidota bacterium]
MGEHNLIQTKSMYFAIEIVDLFKQLNVRKEWVMSKQLLRSGTAVGALIKEAEHSESKKDFVHKLSIALKEANETGYWLELLWKTDYLSNRIYNTYAEKVKELKRLLIAIIKTTKQRYL